MGFNGFREVPNTGGMYLVSQRGEVYSKYTHTKLNPTISGNGVKICTIKFDNGKRKVVNVRTLTARVFRDKLPQVDHLNSDKTDNRVENLEWVTGLENTRRAFMRLKEKKGGGLNGIC